MLENCRKNPAQKCQLNEWEWNALFNSKSDALGVESKQPEADSLKDHKSFKDRT